MHAQDVPEAKVNLNLGFDVVGHVTIAKISGKRRGYGIRSTLFTIDIKGFKAQAPPWWTQDQ